MPSQSYRYYCLDSSGNLHDAQLFVADSDEDAIAKIEAKHPDSLCEVWRGSELIAKLSPQRLRA
jgi:hypothetical protein